MSFQTEKAIVRAHYAALEAATPGNVAEVLAERTSTDWLWRGMHPWHEHRGAARVAAIFWAPLLNAFTSVQRREDIFLAGLNEIDGFNSRWTVSMGHLMGLFDEPFLGIRPTRRIAMLRYAEFNRIEDSRITETALFCDLLHLMAQAGQYPLAPQTGAQLVQPGPRTHDGIIPGDADPSEGKATLELINAMVGDINAGAYPDPETELRQTWAENMIWWGPTGIGATYTVPRYIEQHQRPFRANMKRRVFNGHVCRLAEGHFGGFFGWPNLTLTTSGGLMGLPAGGPADMRVVDLYRREGNKLAENWVFIDMLHFLNMQGVDVLARLQETS